jgi:phage anti-repressor protein
MNGLKVVELGIVPVYGDDDERILVNARDLHDFLESGQEFAHWIRHRLEKYSFSKGEDYLIILSNKVNDSIERGKPKTDYLLSLDTAKEIAMVERNEKGRLVRKYFIECENRLKMAGSAANVVSTEAAEKLRQQAKHLEIMERNSRSRQARILKSTAEFFKAVLSDVSMRAIAGEITTLITGKYLVEPSETESSSLKEEFDLSGIYL